MTNSARRSIDKTLGIEGGYSDHPSDPGGKTQYGITEDLARSYDYKGKMKNLPLSLAKEIYHKEFWLKNNLDEVAKLSEPVAYELFDTAVNTGADVGGKLFQRALNAFNKDEEYYSDIVVDGIIGEKTIGAWEKFHMHRSRKGVSVMLKALNGMQTSYYVRLAENDAKFEDFVFGWINQRVKI